MGVRTLDSSGDITKVEKLMITGLLTVLIFYGFEDLSTYTGLLLMLAGFIVVTIKESDKIKDNPLTFPFLLLLTISTISIFKAVNIPDSLTMLGNVVEIVIAYFAVFYIFTNKSFVFHKRMFYALLTGGLIIGLVGLHQIYLDNMRRIISLLNNSNILGAYMLLLLVPVFSLLYTKTNLIEKIMVIITLVIISLNLFYTLSRSAFLGAIGSFFVFGFFRDKRIIMFLIVLLVLTPVLLPDALLHRLTNTVNRVRNHKEQRLFIWKNAINMFRSSPLIGVGIGQYRSHYKIYNRAPIKNRKFDHAHNIFFQIISEIGILGLLAFGWILIKIIMHLFNYDFTDFTSKNTLAIAFFSSLTGFFIQEQFEFSLIDDGGITILFGILLGWFMALDS